MADHWKDPAVQPEEISPDSTGSPVSSDLDTALQDADPAWDAGQNSNLEIGDSPGGGAPETPAEQENEYAALWADIPDSPADPEVLRLRGLIFQREIAVLKKLQECLADRQFNTRNVSRVLSDALLMLGGKDKQLTNALEPVIDEVLPQALRKRRGELVEALFPLMGPSIRKSIAESFRSMLDNFSKSVEYAFSIKGLRWRFEAMRSGKSFSEVVMLHTLVYRVEQVFFIHAETGLVLQHLVNEGSGAQDADMVSGMLTAIQDFVNDCFASGSEGELESLQLGEYKIFIEKSRSAYLACVVRGTPPSEFGVQLRSTLEILLLKFSDELAAFNGDAAPFTPAVHELEPYLVERYKSEEIKPKWWAKLVLPGLVALLLIVAGGLYWHTAQVQETRQAHTTLMQNGVRTLLAEPGLVLFSVEESSDEPWKITALKDELARDPIAVLRENGFEPAEFEIRTIPYISYDRLIILERLQKAVTLPDTVQMELDDNGALTFTGSAPMAWTVQTRDIARTLPGVKSVDSTAVHDPMVERLTALKRTIEAIVIEFPLGQDVPVGPEMDKLTRAADALVEMEKLARSMGFDVNLTVYGHADNIGLAKRNYELSQARTRTLAALLYARGSSIPIAMYGMGSDYPKDGETARETSAEEQADRRIELRVNVVQSAPVDVDKPVQ